MAVLPDDTIAIVASNLTVAYLSLVKGMAPRSPEEANDVVRQVYRRYVGDLRLAGVIHPEPPPHE